MHKRKIRSLEVSAIGLGCMNISMGYGLGNDENSKRLLQEALDEGYNFFDTAWIYGNGHSESLIGEVLSHRRNEFVLATKCGLGKNVKGVSAADGRPAVLIDQCETSLRRLKTDVIDLYYLHRPDKNIPIEDSVGALKRLVEQGKVLEIGLSEVSSENLRRAHNQHPIAAVQSEYSLWSRTPEHKLLDTCTALGVAFVPFSPLGRQFLTGKAVDVTQLDENDIRSTIARPRFEPDTFAKNSQLLIPFAEIAENLNLTMAQLALAWILARKDKNGDKRLIPIPGTKHQDYMIENAQAGDVELSDEIVSALDDLINENTVLANRYTDEAMAVSDAEKDRI